MKTFFSIFLGLVAFFVGGCGLWVTFAALGRWDGWSGNSGLFLTFSLPSLGVGVLCVWKMRMLYLSTQSDRDQRD